jgi:basic amino acid/polyamine antiporter, APA family
VLEAQKQPVLKRNVNLFQALMYGVGLILGAGIYVLIGDVAAVAGNALWVSFAIAALIATLTGLSYAELSSMFPKAAAEYSFVKNAFRNNLSAFVVGWLITFVAIASAAAVAIGFAGYLGVFVPGVDRMLLAIGLVLILSFVNFVGIRESAWLNTAFTLIELAGLAIIVIAAVMMGSFSHVDYYELPRSTEAPIAIGAGAVLAGTALAFFAFFGFENLANIAEETKNAVKTIPKALILSIAITTGIYMLIALSAIALVGWESLSTSSAPLALAAEKAFGATGSIILSLVALFATSNTVLMMLVAGSRIMFGMARDKALPSKISDVHTLTRTPWVSVVLIMLTTVAVILLSGGIIAAVAKAAVFIIFLVYAVVNLALIWLRYRHPTLQRPFRSPLSIGWFPLLAGLGFVTSLAMLTQFDFVSIVAGIITVGLGVVSYAIFSRYQNMKSRSA